MKIGVFGAGVPCLVKDKSIPFIAVDGGYDELIKQNIQPVYMIGDFDSLLARPDMKNDQMKILPTHKDYTDTEMAILEAVQKGYDEIDLYGVTGGRLDHFVTMMRLLVKYQSVKLTIYDQFNKIYLLSAGEHKICRNEYQYISFFSVNETILTLKNMAYPLDHYHLKYEDGLCVSNEILDKNGYVITTAPVFCIQSNSRI